MDILVEYEAQFYGFGDIAHATQLLKVQGVKACYGDVVKLRVL